jgi:hypothetical protein
VERILNTEPATQPADPAVAWNGEDFLVVWSARYISGTELFGMRVGPLGDMVDQSPWAVSSALGTQHRPSVAWGDDHFLVVWEDGRAGESTRIFATWVTARGEVVDPRGFLVANSRYTQSAPVVVWNGAAFLVVWVEQLGGNNGLDLYGTTVQPGVSSPAPQGLPIVTAPGDQFAPALAWGQNNGLLIWSDLRSGGVGPAQIEETGQDPQVSRIEQQTDLYAVTLAPDGRRIGPTDHLVTSATGAQDHPTVTWDLSRFVAIWADQREGRRQIYGARFSAQGVLLDPGGIPIVQGPAETGPPALAPLYPDQVVALWTEIGQGQHLLVGQYWPAGEERAADTGQAARAPLEQRGALTYVLSDLPPRLEAATTERGELLVVWPGRRPGGGNETQLFMRLTPLPGE